MRCRARGLAVRTHAILWTTAMVSGFGRAATAPPARSPRWSRPGWRNRSAPARRGPVYSLNAALGFSGQRRRRVDCRGAGTAGRSCRAPSPIRPLFLLFAAGSLLCCVLIVRTPDTDGG